MQCTPTSLYPGIAISRLLHTRCCSCESRGSLLTAGTPRGPQRGGGGGGGGQEGPPLRRRWGPVRVYVCTAALFSRRDKIDAAKNSARTPPRDYTNEREHSRGYQKFTITCPSRILLRLTSPKEEECEA